MTINLFNIISVDHRWGQGLKLVEDLDGKILDRSILDETSFQLILFIGLGTALFETLRLKFYPSWDHSVVRTNRAKWWVRSGVFDAVMPFFPDKKIVKLCPITIGVFKGPKLSLRFHKAGVGGEGIILFHEIHKMIPISVGLSVVGEPSIIWPEFGIQVTSNYEKIVESDSTVVLRVL